MDIPLPIALKPLAKLLEKDEPKVLILVGTGVSIGATSASQASWLGLLKHGIDHLVNTGKFTGRWGDELKANLDWPSRPFDLDKALRFAELVEQNLSTPAQPRDFADWLHNSFSDFRPQDGKTDTLNSIQILQQAGALIMTTNYDNLLSDITGLPPITWEEHNDFLKVSRERNKILHIHGHWQHPSSIILGKSSYERIVKDEKIQSLLRTLWLDWSWVYVGCGDGIDDPNLGLMLKWGRQWGDSALTHYFLAKNDKAVALENRPDKPANLVSVPFEEYSDLPNILRSITPTARCSPFVLVDNQFRWFRDPNSSPLNDPFPSQQEYLDGNVPKLDIDEKVLNRLKEHGWAMVLDVASVGKTTLALRMATSIEQRNYPAYYLDFASVDRENASEDISAALGRLSKQNVLMIFDNSHYQPELMRQLWDQWRDNPRGSKLLLIATRTQRHVKTSPAQDLVFFENHITNPAVELRPTQNDLKNILNHIFLRVSSSRLVKPKHSEFVKLNPSLTTLISWHHDYGSALGAFCLAVLRRIAYLERGNWELPLTAAVDWVNEKWLKNLDAEYIENLICIAVFGSQELELSVFEDALPFPQKTQFLMGGGLVARWDTGKFGQSHKYSLREPGWGRLILAAQQLAINEEYILFATAARDVRVLTSLSVRLRTKRMSSSFETLWLFIAKHPNHILQQIHNSSSINLFTISTLLNEVKSSQQLHFADLLWNAIESDPQRFAERAWETSLQSVGSFLAVAKSHERNIDPLWNAIESDPQRFAERAWQTSLVSIESFLAVAKSHGRNVDPLWSAIESDPQRFAERAWENSLKDVRSFLAVAKSHERNVDPLWNAIESDPQRFAERAWENSWQSIGSFLAVAKSHERNIDPLWNAIESDPQRFAERAWENSLASVESFLAVAKSHERNVDPLWNAIETDPQRFAERAWENSLEHIGSFLAVAKSHERNVDPLWNAIESDPQRFAERAWENSLASVESFLAVAKSHGRNVDPLWSAIESDPQRFAERAWENSLASVESFLAVAKSHERNIDPLWNAIESDPQRFAERAWQNSLASVGSFLAVAKSHGRNIDPLWNAIESDPQRFAERAWETSWQSVGSFLIFAKSHERNVDPLWNAIESDPQRFAKRAWQTSLVSIGSFLAVAKSHGRNIDPLWNAIESDPQRFAERAWENSLASVGSFLIFAKSHERNIDPLWSAIESDPQRLAERAWQTSLVSIGSFLAVAKSHGRNIDPLWNAIESDPQRFAECAWQNSLEHIGSFLAVAKSHERNVDPLWNAIESDPQRFAERAWETSLQSVGSFLIFAKSHERNVDPLWNAIESDPQRFAERAWENSLASVGSFLAVAKSHGRNVDPLWNAIESDPQRFAERAWENSLASVESFLAVAKSHGRNVDPLWSAIESDPSRLSAKVKSSSIGDLSALCKNASDTFVKSILSDIRPTHWDEFDDSKSLAGAIVLALRCVEVGREDLKSAIVTKMIKRANWRDYPLGSMPSIALLLNNLSITDATLLPKFLDSLCTTKWLYWQYSQSPCGSLAVGLRMLAMYQPKQVQKRFYYNEIVKRLAKEFSRFSLLMPKEQTEIIQLLGSTTLFGWSVKNVAFDAISHDAVRDLPINILPHHADASKIEEWQYQLWLGLRTFVSITNNTLSMPESIIDRTLNLWRVNLAESSVNLTSVEHHVNQEMVAWLEECIKGGIGLIPLPGIKHLGNN